LLIWFCSRRFFARLGDWSCSCLDCFTFSTQGSTGSLILCLLIMGSVLTICSRRRSHLSCSHAEHIDDNEEDGYVHRPHSITLVVPEVCLEPTWTLPRTRESVNSRPQPPPPRAAQKVMRCQSERMHSPGRLESNLQIELAPRRFPDDAVPFKVPFKAPPPPPPPRVLESDYSEWLRQTEPQITQANTWNGDANYPGRYIDL